MNRVFLLGRLGHEPAPRRTRGGKTVMEMRVATRRPGRGGEETTDWHQVRVWEQLAEACAEHLRAGSPVAVEGQLRAESWIDREGTAHSRTFVLGDRVHFLPDPRPAPKAQGTPSVDAVG
ncbi:MAG: single-stranded DNA-binding protein [Myxococcota bacterium]